MDTQEQSNELDRGGYRTAGAAVGGLGSFGVLVAVVMAAIDADLQHVETRGMFATGCLLVAVGIGMYWWGSRP